MVANGNSTAQSYIDEVLRIEVLPFFHGHQDVDILQQDNACAHISRLAKQILKDNNARKLSWLAFFLDLSPIEHLWDQLGCAVRRHQPQSMMLGQLETALQDEWRNIPQARIQWLIRLMPRRCRACVAANGGHIRY